MSGTEEMKRKKNPIRPSQRHSDQVSILERDADSYRHHRVADIPQGSGCIIKHSMRERRDSCSPSASDKGRQSGTPLYLDL